MRPVQPPSQPHPTPPTVRQIAARTRRQAMGWSLVLASQGIEHTIDRDNASGWTLSQRIQTANSPIVHPKIKTGKEFPSACI
jgi:hypothetical protein